MPEQMLFKSLIESQGVPFTAFFKSDGDYVDGDWVDGVPVEQECIGVVLPLTVGSQNIGETLTYAESGVFSLKDKKLLTTESLEEGTKVLYDGDTYTVQAFKDLSVYTDVNIYVARWREK